MIEKRRFHRGRKALGLLCAYFAAIALSGCGAQTEPLPLEVEEVWQAPSPPPPLSAPSGTDSLAEALGLCQQYALALSEAYPELSVSLDPQMVLGIEERMRLPSGEEEASALASEIGGMTIRLRQQVYVAIEDLCKSGRDVPGGLYDFVEQWEARLAEAQ